MSDLFDTSAMAAGYATARPPVHQRILELARPYLKGAGFRHGLDVGCGAGLSTKALADLVEHCVGLEPSAGMLRWAPSSAPEADFVVGGAETLPFASGSIDLITAAGSLNYVRLEPFFTEAARVLTSQGVLVVYDFLP